LQIYIIDSYDKAVDDEGYLYCVSTSDESYMELIDERDRLEDGGKIYVSDMGRLCAKKDLTANDILYMVEEINDFKGGMAENYVNIQLTINGYHTFYWESERGAETDFVTKTVPLYAAFCI